MKRKRRVPDNSSIIYGKRRRQDKRKEAVRHVWHPREGKFASPISMISRSGSRDRLRSPYVCVWHIDAYSATDIA
jgi:hypothetical protein